MYYKKQGNIPPIIKSGCVYEESCFFDGYLYLKYAPNNVPSETLEEITQEEYEANKPVIPTPEPTPQPISPTEQDVINATNTTLLLKISKALGVDTNA